MNAAVYTIYAFTTFGWARFTESGFFAVEKNAYCGTMAGV
jgi:hypothetical protein